ncbi:MAG TPA: PEP-CTERM sorting domain-containing protein [Myxococcota bacterium]
MRNAIASIFFIALAAFPAAAAPILTIAPSAIDLSPTQTLLTLEVDPNGTAVSTLLFNLSSAATDIEIVGIASAEPGIINVSGPALVGGDYQASFSAFFFPDRIANFSVGTLTVEGFTAGTSLMLSGEFTDALFNTFAIGPTDVAIVGTPEPGTAGLLSLGILGLAVARRRIETR